MKVTSNQAIQATLKGEWEHAVKLNKELLEENEKDVEALNRMGLAYTILGKSKQAKSTYQKVLDIDPLNSIAMKNIKKIRINTNKSENDSTILVNNIFLEEYGKTKVVDLINLSQAEILDSLRTGQIVEMSVKRLKIFISQGKNYIGVLPDDIGKRLMKLMTGGNLYEAYVKSCTSQNVTIFIRELKKSNKFKDQPSFYHVNENKLDIENKNKKSKKIEKVDQSDNSED